MEKKLMNQLKRTVLVTTSVSIIAVSACRIRLGKSSKKSPSPEISLPSPVATTGTFSSTEQLTWISLDGLQREPLQAYVNLLPNPKPKGLKFLLTNSNWKNRLQINNPTITASSHISTITCTPPGTHGIYANSQWNGKKMVSGFSEAYVGESLPKRLSQSGIKTAVYGYPGFDGTSPERTVDLGGSYFNPATKSKDVKLALGDMQKLVLSTGSSTPDFEINLNHPEDSPDSLELTSSFGNFKLKSKTWFSLFVPDSAGKLGKFEFYFENLENKASIYISPYSQNTAYPESFNNELTNEKEVFSSAKDYKLLSLFGSKPYLDALGLRSEHFANVAKKIITNHDVKALFLYFEDLDSIGHQFAGNPTNTPEIVAYLENFDTRIDSLISKLLEQNSNIVIVGDHGMSKIRYEYNLNSIVSDGKPVSLKFKTITSGGIALFYPPEGVEITEPAPRSEGWFEKTVEDLRTTNVVFDNNKPLFAEVVVKGSDRAKSLGLDGPKMPWIIALSHEGVSLGQKLSTKNDEPAKSLLSKAPEYLISEELIKENFQGNPSELSSPVPAGQHGHLNSDPSLATSLLLIGPKLDTLNTESIHSNIELVPAVSKALGFPVPKGCSN